MIDLERRSTNPSALDDAIDEVEGKGSAARFRTFLERADMQALRDRARPLQVAEVGNRVVENLWRHLIIQRFKLERGFVPVEVGGSLSDELEAILKPVNDELDAVAERGPEYARFTSVIFNWPLIHNKTISPDVHLLQSFDGIVAELRDACVQTR